MQINYYIFPISSILILCLINHCQSPADSDLVKKQNDSIVYARIYSGTSSSRNWNDEYWDNVAIYMDVNVYNGVMDLNRTPESKYLASEDYWCWVTDSLRNQFKKMRNELK